MKKLNKSSDNISSMFNSIASYYDFIGHLFSLGADYRWRKKAINTLGVNSESKCLDVATGTGDMTFYIAKKMPATIVGIDISDKMLNVALKKAEKARIETEITFLHADAENIPFPNESFDIVTVAFGVRNFNNLEKSLTEIKRVLKVGGQLMIIELTVPENSFGKLYRFYLTKFMPYLAYKISKKSKAYHYLPESIAQFSQGKEFVEILNRLGYSDNCYHFYSFGIATMYKGYKKRNTIVEF